jgi:hypothetical protein
MFPSTGGGVPMKRIPVLASSQWGFVEFGHPPRLLAVPGWH